MVVIATAPVFAASKRRDHQESTMKLFRALIQFLGEERFCTSDVIARFEAEPTALILTDEDFTADGFAWVKSALHPWLRRVQRRTQKLTFEEMMESLRQTKNA